MICKMEWVKLWVWFNGKNYKEVEEIMEDDELEENIKEILVDNLFYNKI